MIAFVVDVQVMMYASGLTDDDVRAAESEAFLQRLRDTNCGRLVLDDESVIENMYQGKMRDPLVFGRQWVDQMRREGRVTEVRRARVPRSVRIKFAERKFVGEDFERYTRTAATESTTLVSYDPHYPRVRTLLRKEFAVRIVEPPAATTAVVEHVATCRE